MSGLVASKWFRIAAALTVVGALAAAAAACSVDNPAAAGAGGITDIGRPGACSTPQEGCPCTGGGTAECRLETRSDNDYVWCAVGSRSCNAGSWGACVATGTITAKSKALIPGLASGLGTRALGAPATCDGGLNPCDPYCTETSDTATGTTNDAGLLYADGGLVIGIGSTCGNGILEPGEGCDDGNVIDIDGCSLLCVVQAGFKCLTPGSPCTATTCGDGTREGAESCDDGNLRPFDGCSPSCESEPDCTPSSLPDGGPTTTGCVGVCGDGVKFASEACDDGNTVDGDGCSSLCAIEMGASCSTTTTALPPSVTVPVVYRDFRTTDSAGPPATSRHPDFEFPFSGPGSFNTGVILGVVKDVLGADQAPQYLHASAPAIVAVTSQTTFDQWYHDTAGINLPLYGSLTLTKQPDNSYVYTSHATPQPGTYESFFPIDGLGFGNHAATGHNYGFTSELRYAFTFDGGEQLNFLGDDDLWVFINGRLAVDLGGAHGPETGSVTLDPTNAAKFGLVAGNSYRLDVFQAERHSTGSSYELTLRGFEKTKSTCTVPTTKTFVRDFEGTCPPASYPVWRAFRWKAAVPPGTSIDFRAATAATVAALPPGPPGAAPTTVPIGSATSTNSPPSYTLDWVSEMDTSVTPAVPYPVSKHLTIEGNDTMSKAYLRVYMKFNGTTTSSPRLNEWQQLYDCIPSE